MYGGAVDKVLNFLGKVYAFLVGIFKSMLVTQLHKNIIESLFLEGEE